MIEWYVKDCRKHCSAAYQLALKFKMLKSDIAKACRSMSRLKLISIKRNYVYATMVSLLRAGTYIERKFEIGFSSYGNEYKKTYAICTQPFRETPLIFRKGGRYMFSVEDQIETALRKCLKVSLKDFNKAINGDGKNDPQPLFKTNAVLKQGQVVFEPSMISLTGCVNSVCKGLVSIVACVDRLVVFGDARDEDNDERQTFYDVLSNESEVLDILVSIMNGLSANTTEMNKYLSYWDKYKFLWDVDIDAFLRRYAKAKSPTVAV